MIFLISDDKSDLRVLEGQRSVRLCLALAGGVRWEGTIDLVEARSESPVTYPRPRAFLTELMAIVEIGATPERAEAQLGRASEVDDETQEEA